MKEQMKYLLCFIFALEKHVDMKTNFSHIVILENTLLNYIKH